MAAFVLATESIVPENLVAQGVELVLAALVYAGVFVRFGLSAREREVLRLLLDGRTNREIGAALFISDKTASSHVTHILDKLGVTSRGAAAAVAARAGFGSNAR